MEHNLVCEHGGCFQPAVGFYLTEGNKYCVCNKHQNVSKGIQSNIIDIRGYECIENQKDLSEFNLKLAIYDSFLSRRIELLKSCEVALEELNEKKQLLFDLVARACDEVKDKILQEKAEFERNNANDLQQLETYIRKRGSKVPTLNLSECSDWKLGWNPINFVRCVKMNFELHSRIESKAETASRFADIQIRDQLMQELSNTYFAADWKKLASDYFTLCHHLDKSKEGEVATKRAIELIRWIDPNDPDLIPMYLKLAVQYDDSEAQETAKELARQSYQNSKYEAELYFSLGAYYRRKQSLNSQIYLNRFKEIAYYVQDKLLIFLSHVAYGHLLCSFNDFSSGLAEFTSAGQRFSADIAPDYELLLFRGYAEAFRGLGREQEEKMNTIALIKRRDLNWIGRFDRDFYSFLSRIQNEDAYKSLMSVAVHYIERNPDQFEEHYCDCFS